MQGFSKLIFTFAFILPYCSVIEAENKKCDNTVIECIKNVNVGKYPVSAWTSLAMICNSDYSIVWYSKGLIEKDSLKCVTTRFGIFGAKDTYYHSCTDKEVISFKPSFSIFDNTFTINDYQGMNLKAHAIYYKKYCLGLYVCSPYGVTGPHVTVYCPTHLLGTDQVKAEIEEVKAKLTSCNINDGSSLCEQKC